MSKQESSNEILMEQQDGKTLDMASSDNFANQNEKPRIPSDVIFVGIAMALMNVSYVMCYTYTGPYLQSIGITISKTGMLMGFCALVSQFTKLLSGFLSDLYRRRKNIVILGYIISLLSRTMFAFSKTAGYFSMGQIFDRFGNGTSATPRDTIVSDIAPKKIIGSCFGLKRSLAYIGSVVGGILALTIMHKTQNYKTVFISSTIPAILAILLLAIFVKEPNTQLENTNTSQQNNQNKKNKKRFRFSKLNQFGKEFWIVISINFIYMSAKISETALILHLNKIEMSVTFGAIVMILINIGAMLAAYSSGKIGDKTRRTNLIIISLAFFLCSYLTLRYASTQALRCVSIILWGMHMATSQNAFVSLVSEYSPKGLKGTGMGVLWLSTGMAEYFGDHFIGGYIHQKYGANSMFFVGGSICVICLIFTIRVNKTVLSKNAYNKTIAS